MLKTSSFIPSHSKKQRITFFGTIYEIFIVQQKQQTFFFLSDLAPPIARSFLLLYLAYLTNMTIAFIKCKKRLPEAVSFIFDQV